MSDAPRISFIVPTLNSEAYAQACLRSLCSIPESETVVVDNHSTDDTRSIAESLGARVFVYGPNQAVQRVFGAPAQRNYGARQAEASVIYFVDIDMLVSDEVVDEALTLIRAGFDAVIVAEESFGIGFWADCKALERHCYRGDDDIEAPRVIRKAIFDKIGGLSERVAADDWDFAQRLKTGGFRIARTTGHILHNEGALTLRKLMFKRYLYGQQMFSYFRENGINFQQATPVRRAYFRNYSQLLKRPRHLTGLVLMRSLEFAAGAAGLLAGLWRARGKRFQAAP